MDFKELAEKYFKYHNEPLSKPETPPTKFFLESPNDKDRINDYHDALKKSLEYVRVERRCARSKGIWREDEALCEVTKPVGNMLKNFGFQDKNGVYLFPEETLFLVEQNKLELTHNSKQVSIYEAYNLVLNHISLNKYRVYKTLVEQGYKLLNKEAIKKFHLRLTLKNKSTPENKKKRRNSISTDLSDNEIKKPKIYMEHKNETLKNTNIKQEPENFEEILKQLEKQGPKQFVPCESSKQPDYFGFLPSVESKQSHDFNLYIRDDTNLNDFGILEDVKNIFAICTNDTIAFDRHINVNVSLINE